MALASLGGNDDAFDDDDDNDDEDGHDDEDEHDDDDDDEDEDGGGLIHVCGRCQFLVLPTMPCSIYYSAHVACTWGEEELGESSVAATKPRIKILSLKKMRDQ